MTLANGSRQFAYTTFTTTATDAADFSNVTDASYMFYGSVIA